MKFLAAKFLALLRFLRLAHSEENDVPSSRRLVFSGALGMSALYAAIDVMVHKGLRQESLDVIHTIIYATAGYVGITRIADK